MGKLDEVTDKLADIRYMTEDRAEKMHQLITEIGASKILELGFYQGKSTCYIAAMLEDRGDGHITTIDTKSAKRYSPNIHDNLSLLGLEHRVSAIYARRSYTWELARMIKNRQQFDLCYLDGGHTWDVTGFGFVLVDLLLRPGGIIVLDDMNWSIAKSIAVNAARAQRYELYDEDEKQEEVVTLVWDTIVPRLGYERQHVRELNWGVARKPALDTRRTQPGRSLLGFFRRARVLGRQSKHPQNS